LHDTFVADRIVGLAAKTPNVSLIRPAPTPS
jgi:hypothetical protein